LLLVANHTALNTMWYK